MNDERKDKREKNRIQKEKKTRAKKFKNKNSKKRLQRGEIILKDIDEEE